MTAILAMGVVQFIADSSEGYASTANRNKLSSSGRVAIDRLAMELRNALPNSIRTSNALTAKDEEVIAGDASDGDQCIEFIPVLGTTNYINPPIFPLPESSSFNVIEFDPDLEGTTDVFAAIYPINTDELYDGNNPGPVASGVTVASAAVPTNAITLPLPTLHQFNRPSRLKRFFLIDEPISFCIKGDKLFRYTGYGFIPAQQTPINIGGACPTAGRLPCLTPDRKLVTNSLANAGLEAFDLIAASLRHNAIIALEMNFSVNGDDVRLKHEVLIHNVP